MVVAKLIRTCRACPSQWEGVLEDGQNLYIRYRWGKLSVSIAPKGESAVFGETIITKLVGNGMDGWMDFTELKSALKHIIHFNCEEEHDI